MFCKIYFNTLSNLRLGFFRQTFCAHILSVPSVLSNPLFLSFSCLFFFYFGPTAPSGPGPPHSGDFYITNNDAPQSVELLWTSDQLVVETYTLTTHNTHNRQISMPPVGFEPKISAGERPQTHALNRIAAGTGLILLRYI